METAQLFEYSDGDKIFPKTEMKSLGIRPKIMDKVLSLNLI